MDAKGKLFNRYVPTGPEVAILMAHFKDIPEDVLVSHRDIAALIEVEWGKSRYRSVIEAFAKAMLRERNQQIGAVHGHGLKILTASERVLVATSMSMSAFKKINVVHTRFAAIPRDRLATDVERKILDNRQVLIAKLIDEHNAVKKDMALPKLETLPRLSVIPK